MGCGSPSSWYGGLITKRLPPSLTLFASESAARRPRRQPLNVIRHRREHMWYGAPEKRRGGPGASRNEQSRNRRRWSRPEVKGDHPPPLELRRRSASVRWSLQGSEGRRSALKEVTCVGGETGWKRAATFSGEARVRGLVGVGFEKKSRRGSGAPAPAEFNRFEEERNTLGTADGRRNGRHRDPGSSGF